MSYDDDLAFEEIPVSLAIYPEYSVFSGLDPLTYNLITIISAVCIVVLFLTVSYKCILPVHIRDKLFGFHNESSSESFDQTKVETFKDV